MTENSPSPRAALAAAILLSAGAFTALQAPEAEADVVYSPVVQIVNRTVEVNLTVEGTSAWLDVMVEYDLNESAGVDEIFDTGLCATGASRLAAQAISPTSSTLAENPAGFNLTFNTTEKGSSVVRVKYRYTVDLSNAGSVNFSQALRSTDEVHWEYTRVYLMMADCTFRLNSNIPVSVFNGTAFTNGTEILLSYRTEMVHPWEYRVNPLASLFHEVTWSTAMRAATIRETVFSRLTPERFEDWGRLILSEEVNITIGPRSGGYSYFLNGRLLLNGSLAGMHGNPVWLWFPNNITDAEVYLYSERCQVQKSSVNGQGGFYISLRSSFSRPALLVVNITGNLTDPWCDFILVTVPTENSTVRYILPGGARITEAGSPFELAGYNNTTSNQVYEFTGRCAGRGPVHLGWAPDMTAGCRLEASAGYVNAGSATVLWSTDRTPGFTEYNIFVSDRRGFAGDLAGRVADQSAGSFEVQNLRSNTTYYLTVRKVLAGNLTVDSSAVEVRTLPWPLAEPKLIVYYTDPDGDVPVLRWTKCENPDFTGYELFQSEYPDRLGQSVFRTDNRSMLEREFSSLQRNTNYYFTLRVFAGSSGRATSPAVQVFIPLASQERTNLSAFRRSGDPGVAHLLWEASNAADFRCYEVYMSTEPGALGERLTSITGRTLVEYTAGGLEKGRDYYFTVRTVTNRSGSVDSNQAKAGITAVDTRDGEGPFGLDGPWVSIGIGATALVAILVTAVVMRSRKRKK